MTIQVYVGTYAKYNNGSIAGKWLDLEDYSDHEAFIEACHALHNDEEDPELMFQDYEGFPDKYYSESSIDSDLWPEYIDLDEDDREMLEAAQSCMTYDMDIDQARSAYQGKYDNDEDFAYQTAEDCGLLNDNQSWPYTSIDWSRAARDLMMDYSSHDGHYFSNNY